MVNEKPTEQPDDERSIEETAVNATIEDEQQHDYLQAAAARKGVDFSEPEIVGDAPVFQPAVPSSVSAPTTPAAPTTIPPVPPSAPHASPMSAAPPARMAPPAPKVGLPMGPAAPTPSPVATAPVAPPPALAPLVARSPLSFLQDAPTEPPTALLPTSPAAARPAPLRQAPSVVMGSAEHYVGLPSADELMTSEQTQRVAPVAPGPTIWNAAPALDIEPTAASESGLRKYGSPVALLALVVAFIALLCAVRIIPVGSNNAATGSPAANSVGHAQIKAGSLTKDDFAPGTVLAGSAGPAGVAGATGAAGRTGPTGSAGAKGPSGALTSVKYVSATASTAGSDQSVTATCPATLKAIGGGGATAGTGGVITASNLSGNSWQATATSLSTATGGTGATAAYRLTATVVCAPVNASGH